MTISSSNDVRCPRCTCILSEDEMEHGYCMWCDANDDFDIEQRSRQDEVDFFESEQERKLLHEMDFNDGYEELLCEEVLNCGE